MVQTSSSMDCLYMGVSENSVPLKPMVLLIIIPFLNGYNWEYTLFSDKPIFFNWIPHDIFGFATTVPYVEPVLFSTWDP